MFNRNRKIEVVSFVSVFEIEVVSSFHLSDNQRATTKSQFLANALMRCNELMAYRCVCVSIRPQLEKMLLFEYVLMDFRDTIIIR